MYELRLEVKDESGLQRLATAMKSIDAEVIELQGYDLAEIGTEDARYPYGDPTVGNLFRSPSINPGLFVELAKLLKAPWGLALLKYFDFSIEKAADLAKKYWFTTFDEATSDVEWNRLFKSIVEKNEYFQEVKIIPTDFPFFLSTFDDKKYLLLNHYDEIIGVELTSVFEL